VKLAFYYHNLLVLGLNI